jgi:hypothetical protein
MAINPSTLIHNSNKDNLLHFVGVPMNLIEELYYGAFIRYKDRSNQLHYGGYLTEIGRQNNTLYIELTDNISNPIVKYTLPLNTVAQLWKKVDFCLFEILELQRNVIKPMLVKLDRIDKTLRMLGRH